MPKTFTEAYEADPAAGDGLTGNEITGFDPPQPASVSKAYTLNQLRSWLSNYFSGSGHTHSHGQITDPVWILKPDTATEGNLAEFNATRDVIDSGIPSDNVILRSEYDARTGRTSPISLTSGTSSAIETIPNSVNEIHVSIVDLSILSDSSLTLAIGFLSGGVMTYFPGGYIGGFYDGSPTPWPYNGALLINSTGVSGNSYTLTVKLIRGASDQQWHIESSRTFYRSGGVSQATTAITTTGVVYIPSGFLNGIKITSSAGTFVSGTWNVQWRK